MKRLVSALIAAVALVGVRQRHRLVSRAHASLRSPRLYLPLDLTSPRRLDLARRLFERTAPPAPPVPFREDRVPARDGDRTIRVLVYDTHRRPTPSGVLLWIHGGGMVMGTPELDHRLCGRLADDADVLVVSIDYRLAPEHPFPAALDDCHDVLRWIHERAEQLGIDPTRVAVGGGSAGGGLAASLCQRALDSDGSTIAFQLLQYPMLDDRTALRRDLDALVWSNRSNDFGWSSYLGHPVADGEERPHAVPARRDDLHGLPTAWIGVGDIDLFHDEDVDYARRLAAAGVTCDLHVESGMYHGADQLSPTSEITTRFIDNMVGALRDAVGSTTD